MTAYSFSQLIDFTRTTPGTFVGSNGLIQTTPQSRNLLTFTQEFDNGAWTKNAATVTANSTSAPDGTPTADTLTATAGTGVIPRVADTSVNTANGLAHTASIYVKAGTYTFFQIYLNSQASEWANFTLTGAGTATANGASTATITALSNGWYRCSITYTAGGTDRRPFFMLAASGTATRAQAWNPVGTETIFIWGAQLEQASTASDYTRNVGGLFPPRFDYDPVTLAPRGILIEEQRTNLLLWSEQFDNNTSWFKPNMPVTANATTSPDGTANADKMAEDDATSQHYIGFLGSYTSGVTYTHSFYVKAAEKSTFVITLGTGAFGGASGAATFNLATGVVSSVSGTGATATIVNAGNGWYRCSLVQAAVTTTTNTSYISIAGLGSYTGTAGAGIFIWGAQLEAGAFATSYIQTLGNPGGVTRAPDQASIVAPMFSPWFNAASGTFLVEWQQGGSEGVQNLISANDGATSNIINVQNDTSSGAGVSPGALVVNGGAPQANITGSSISAGSTNKSAFAYALNNFAYSQNGAAAIAGPSGTVPTVNRMDIGNRVNGVFTNGHIRRVTYYPVRLSDLQLQALSQ